MTETPPRLLPVGILLCLLVIEMSRTAESSHVQLCWCNPNTWRNAKSSLPAALSHPTLCAAVEKRGLGRVERQVVQGEERSSYIFGPISGFLALGFSKRRTLSKCKGSGKTSAGGDTLAHRLGPLPSQISSGGGSVNMTFSLCMQKQHKHKHPGFMMPA